MAEELTLANVLNHKNDFNLALPFTASQQINPFLKLTVSPVMIETDTTKGEIYKISAVNRGTYREPIWEDSYCLCKTALERLATAAGIQMQDANIQRIDENTWSATAAGSLKLPDGTVTTRCETKTIPLLDEEQKIRAKYTLLAERGITGDKNIRDAKALYKGEIKTYQTQKGTESYFMPAPEEKQRYITNSVRNAMQQLRANAPQKAATGAKNRVIRSLLGLRNTYTMEELKRPFAVVRMAFSPDFNDPVVKQMMIMQAMGSMGMMFGTSSTPSLQMASSISTQDNTIVNGIDIDNPEASPLYNSGFELEAPTAPVVPPQPPKENTAEKYYATDKCSSCGAPINKAEYNYSIKNYNRPLCRRCQEIKRKADKK